MPEEHKKKFAPEDGNERQLEEGSSQILPTSPMPTAPQLVNEFPVSNSDQAPTNAPAPGFIYPTVHNTTNNAPSTTSTATIPAPYDAPPPSYQTAMSYPAAPTYGGSSSDPKFYSGQPPTYYQTPQIANTQLPQPATHTRIVTVSNPASNAVITVQQGIQCRKCNLGVIIRRTDMCCLLCLIMLTIFTFPFGLVFLCCVPCTIQNRCSNCNSLLI